MTCAQGVLEILALLREPTAPEKEGVVPRLIPVQILGAELEASGCVQAATLLSLCVKHTPPWYHLGGCVQAATLLSPWEVLCVSLLLLLRSWGWSSKVHCSSTRLILSRSCERDFLLFCSALASSGASSPFLTYLFAEACRLAKPTLGASSACIRFGFFTLVLPYSLRTWSMAIRPWVPQVVHRLSHSHFQRVAFQGLRQSGHQTAFHPRFSRKLGNSHVLVKAHRGHCNLLRTGAPPRVLGSCSSHCWI